MVGYEREPRDSRSPSPRDRSLDARDDAERRDLDRRDDPRGYSERDMRGNQRDAGRDYVTREDERAMRNRRRDDEPIDPRGYGNAGGSEAGRSGYGNAGRSDDDQGSYRRTEMRTFNFGAGAGSSPQISDAFGGPMSIGQQPSSRGEGALRSGFLRQHNDAVEGSERSPTTHGGWRDAEFGASRESHRGKGPRGYTRSDARIEEDLNDCLTEDHDLDATSIDVSVKEGEITLAGTVSSRACKRRAEDLAESISGVKHVQNNLRVKRAESFGTGSSSESSRTSGASSRDESP